MKRLGTIIVCIFSLSVYDLKAQVYTINTYAGKGRASYYGNRVKATIAYFNYPCGVASDLAGNIYIADYDNYRVRRVDKGDSVFNFAGNGAYGFSGDNGIAGTAKMARPTSVA